MIERYWRDPVVRFLVENSSLTKAQIDTLLASRESKLKDGVKLVEKGHVSKGSFLRTLRQGQSNIEGAVYSVFLMAYLGLLTEETGQQLGRTTTMMCKVRDGIREEETGKLLQALQEFGGKLSGRRKFML
jgi:hypothetical protein